MMTQLSPPIPLDTPKGKGFAHFMIDYSQEHDLHWVVFIDETGECWTFGNRDIRMQKNITLGRTFEKKEKKNELLNSVALGQTRQAGDASEVLHARKV